MLGRQRPASTPLPTLTKLMQKTMPLWHGQHPFLQCHCHNGGGIGLEMVWYVTIAVCTGIVCGTYCLRNWLVRRAEHAGQESRTRQYKRRAWPWPGETHLKTNLAGHRPSRHVTKPTLQAPCMPIPGPPLQLDISMPPGMNLAWEACNAFKPRPPWLLPSALHAGVSSVPGVSLFPLYFSGCAALLSLLGCSLGIGLWQIHLGRTR